MAELLSDEWIAEFAAATADLPERPGASATVSVSVTGGPGGRKAERTWHWRMVDGRVVAAGPGPAPDAADGEAHLVVTQPWDDNLAALRGEAGLDVAFMRGTTKVVGSTGVLMALLPVLRSEAWRAACRPLADAAAA